MHLYEIFENAWKKKNGSIWIISDTHFSDKDTFRHRQSQFEKVTGIHVDTVEELDEYMIKLINSTVGKAGTLICLGDVGNLDCVKRLRASYKVLIMGNHEKGASNYKRLPNPHLGVSYLTKDKISKLPKEIQRLGNYVVDNQLFDEVYEGPLMINEKIILSHEPIMNLPKYLFNIHGHDHNITYIDNRHLNVCADNKLLGYKPLNLLSLIKNGLTSRVTSIHRETIDFATARKRKREQKHE